MLLPKVPSGINSPDFIIPFAICLSCNISLTLVDLWSCLQSLLVGYQCRSFVSNKILTVLKEKSSVK